MITVGEYGQGVAPRGLTMWELTACQSFTQPAIVSALMSDAPAPSPHLPPSARKSRVLEEERATRAAADRELMSSLTSGTEEGFATFYGRFSPGLFSLVYRILQDQKESEDVVQEAFVQMWKNAASYDAKRSGLFTWAVMIARNRAIDRLRSRQRRYRIVEAATAELGESAAMSTAESADAALSQSDENARVRAALATLPEPQRHAIDLAFFGGLTQAEISTKIGAPLGTIKARIRRGLLALREALPQSS